MAAATGVRNDGAAAIRTTKGLLFIFTLLSLVCSSCSLIDKEQLAEIKERHERIKEQLERLKSKAMSVSIHCSERLAQYYNQVALMEDYKEDFPDLGEFLMKTKGLLDHTKAHCDKQTEKVLAEIGDMENTMGESDAIINCLEKQEAIDVHGAAAASPVSEWAA